MADLTCNLGKIILKNPVMTASGTFGYGFEYHQYYDIAKLGAVVVKGIRMTPSNGNPTPRVVEVTGGMLNAIGLQGPGVDHFLHDDHYLPFLRRVKAATIVNIWGTTIAEYGQVAAALEAEKTGILALEINISCPNVKAGGAAFGTDPKLAAAVVAEVRKNTTLPLITKLSPNVSDIGMFAKTVVDAGSDMISLINTLTGMVIDIHTRRPKLANRTGGFSGPAVKPVAVRMVYDVAQAVKVPIIGMGGICSGDDAIEFLLAGASAVAVGTANFVDPYTPLKVIDRIAEYLDENHCANVSEIVGAIRL